MRRIVLSGIVCLCLIIYGCRTIGSGPESETRPAPPPESGSVGSHELMNALLWIQTSAEYRMICRAVFQSAGIGLDAALADPGWTAAPEQTGDFSDLPPAVVLDIDETVLDNSAFEGSLIEDGAGFSPRAWKEWISMEEAPAVPGAPEFIQAAGRLGVTVFFVTNRDASEEEATRDNLISLGISLPVDRDTLLMRNERPGWTSDKSSRRAFIALSHRVLLLVGDDLGDFIDGNGCPEDRLARAESFSPFWGSRWFLLPNPLYGSWENSLYCRDKPADRTEELAIKSEWVKSFRRAP